MAGAAWGSMLGGAALARARRGRSLTRRVSLRPSLPLLARQYAQMMELAGDGNLTFSHTNINIGLAPAPAPAAQEGDDAAAGGLGAASVPASGPGAAGDEGEECATVEPGLTIAVAADDAPEPTPSPASGGGRARRLRPHRTFPAPAPVPGGGSGDKYYVAFRVTDAFGQVTPDTAAEIRCACRRDRPFCSFLRVLNQDRAS